MFFKVFYLSSSHQLHHHIELALLVIDFKEFHDIGVIDLF